MDFIEYDTYTEFFERPYHIRFFRREWRIELMAVSPIKPYCPFAFAFRAPHHPLEFIRNHPIKIGFSAVWTCFCVDTHLSSTSRAVYEISHDYSLKKSDNADTSSQRASSGHQ